MASRQAGSVVWGRPVRIYLIWTESGREFTGVYGGTPQTSRDWEDVRVPKAALWLWDGLAADVDKAKEYTNTGHNTLPKSRMYVYTTELTNEKAAKQSALDFVLAQ